MKKKMNSPFNLKMRSNNFWLILLFAALVFTGCSRKPVATVTSEAEAIQIVTTLRDYDIQSDKEAIGDEKNRQYQIFLEEGFFGGGDNQSAYQVLRQHCLPRQEPPPVQDTSMIGSTEVERAKIQRQSKISIINMLQKLPGVTCVDVTFVPPQDQLASITPYPATASVNVVYKNQDFPYKPEDIKSLVATSVPGLKPELVTAVLTYQPIQPLARQKNNATQKLAVVGGAGLLLVVGAVLLVYFWQKRRQRTVSTALVERGADENGAEPIETNS